MTRPSQRREMAETAVAQRGISIALACRTFGVSETCYRYSPKLNDENEQIADLLIGLTKARKTWGFGLCFLYLRNVQGHGWNHKRVYRIYREQELNLRIIPANGSFQRFAGMKPSRRCRITPRIGYGPITMTAPIWASAASHPPKPRNATT